MMKNETFENMLNDFKNGTYNLTCNGKCTGCGECCSNILPMTNDEISVIKKYIKQNDIKEHVHVVAPLANPTLDMTCPFLDDSKSCEKCTIYEVRPKICRDFICDPKQRPKLDLEWGLKCKPVNVREEFFR
jgi:hypothetical protein